jgi:hypothetical protein
MQTDEPVLAGSREKIITFTDMGKFRNSFASADSNICSNLIYHRVCA